MGCREVDDKLVKMLHDMNYFSRLKTCLFVRLADHAAQLCGCRSTRQIDEGKNEDVDKAFDSLILILFDCIRESLDYISSNHTYLDQIYELNEDSLEILLEDTLYEMTTSDCKSIFTEKFFK